MFCALVVELSFEALKASQVRTVGIPEGDVHIACRPNLAPIAFRLFWCLQLAQPMGKGAVTAALRLAEAFAPQVVFAQGAIV